MPDAKLNKHLIKLTSGQYGWLLSIPAIMSHWSELARNVMLPACGNDDQADTSDAEPGNPRAATNSSQGSNKDRDPIAHCSI
ncbi:hypothetical protein A8144_01105 [Mycobacterium leprae 3125609]|nr:hypothetical protein A8144_01105 [Mycobacterium leprae 3125609]OAX72350.1 hypothetical protein A3216_01185 [Mycobacterium leprae 7935681]